MKKLLLILLFVPIVSFGQNLIDDKIQPFKELLSEPKFYNTKSFFKGYWIDPSRLLKLAETTFGIQIFNSGPHTNGFKSSYTLGGALEGEFGYYNPIFLGELIKTIKSMSPKLKTALKPFYFRIFETPLRKLINNQIEDHFNSDCNRWLLDRIKNKDDIKEILYEIFFGIENNCDVISAETLFWIRRDYDGTSKQFLELFNLIMKEFDPKGFYASSKLNLNTIIDQDYYVSAKGGLNVREAPDAKSKKVVTLLFGQKVKIESKTGVKLTINETDKRTVLKQQIEGEWVKIVSENNITGYLFDGYLVPFKPHTWSIFTTVSDASLNLKDTDLNTSEIKISYIIETMFYKNLKVGEIVQFYPDDKDLPNLEFRVTSVEKVKYEDYDLAPECCDEYNVEAKILKNSLDKYLSLNKEEIEGLVIHPPVNDVKFLAAPNNSSQEMSFTTTTGGIPIPLNGTRFSSALDFDNDGNPDFRSFDECIKGSKSSDGGFYCELYGGGTQILIDNKWVDLTYWTPM